MAFVTVPASLGHGSRVASWSSVNFVRMSASSGGEFRLSRRAIVSGAVAASLLQFIPAITPDANAAVDIDLDRFGDKGIQFFLSEVDSFAGEP